MVHLVLFCAPVDSFHVFLHFHSPHVIPMLYQRHTLLVKLVRARGFGDNRSIPSLARGLGASRVRS